MLIDKAVAFATKAHEGQFRKGTHKPYIVHPLEVAAIVATMTSDQEIISAAVLHDTVEDCKDVTIEEIQHHFGNRIAEIVAQESEDKSKSWAERKMHTIKHLNNAPIEVQMVALGDKLSNIRDISRDYPIVGEELWNRFRMKDKRIIGWYYKEIQKSLKKELGHTSAYQEYCKLVKNNFD